MFTERGYECGKNNNPGVDKELCDFNNSPDILLSVIIAESEVNIETVPDIVPIKYIGPYLFLKELFLCYT